MTPNHEFNLEDLVEFLLEARKSGYAGSAQKVDNPQRPGFKEFAPYKKGLFEYVDSYSGHYYAPGQEVIRYNGIPIWNMSYNGGMLPEFHGNLEFSKRVYNFLKIALLKAEKNNPFRGPPLFEDDNFSYDNTSKGDITNFHGSERVWFKGFEEIFVQRVVFKQDYIGGLIIHK